MAFNEEDMPYAAECFDGKYMMELDVPEGNIVKTGTYLIDSIKAYYITGGEVLNNTYLSDEAISNLG